MAKRVAPPVRLGIVGVGWGASHARVAHALAPLARVQAICARRRERLAPLARELGLPEAALEQRWEALVRRDDVDLVVITAPDYLHHPITLAAVAHGKHVFCDKPLAMHAGQAREMLEAAERAGVCHFTGFTWRFAPPFATLRRLQETDRLGPVQFVDGHFRIGPPAPSKEWQLDPEQRAGGVLGNLGVHLIDLARYLAAEAGHLPEPDGARWRVWARCDAVARPLPPADQPRSSANDLCWIHLEMAAPGGSAREAGGAGAPRPADVVQARLQVSQLLTLRATDPVRVEVHGALGSAVGYANPLAPHRQRLTFLARTSDEPEPVAPLEFPGGLPAPPTAALPSGGLLRPTIQHLYEAHILPAVTGAGPAAAGTPTFRDGWIAQRVMDAALMSSDLGRWVEV